MMSADEAEFVRLYLASPHRAVAGGRAEPLPIAVDRFTAVCLVGQLQLALRHPQNDGPSAGVAMNFARQLIDALARDESPRFRELLERGFDPAYDVERGEGQEGGPR